MARLSILVVLVVVLGWVSPAEAQTRVYSAVAQCGAASDLVISSSGDSFTCGVAGYASLKLQTLDSYSGTWEVQCSVDGTTFDTDDELKVTLLGGAAADSITDTVGIFDVNVAGCQSIKVISTAGFAASDTTFAARAVAAGGGSATVTGGDASSANQDTIIASLDVVDDTAAEDATEYLTVRLSNGTDFSTLADDATHDSAAKATGPQVMVGATSTYQTAVTSGDASRAAAGLDGILITRPNAHVGDFVKGLVAITDGSSTSLVAAQGAGIRFCATTLIVSNSSATNVTLDIRDGTAGSVIATIPAAANMGGAAITLPTPLCTTANTIMAADPSAAASTVTTTAIGFRTAQ